MSDIPFGLESKSTYAALSPSDLQSLGRRAAVEYLSGSSSLNDSIVKIAREHPSISTHQVRRVVEFANQETFSRLFSDNEKYASDKNIDFSVADPGEILLEINNGARPQTMSPAADDYARGSVKLGQAGLEADAALSKLFLGVDFAPPGLEKVACAQRSKNESGDLVLDRIFDLTSKHASANGDDYSSVLSRVLGDEKSKQADVAPGMMPQAPAPMPQEEPMSAEDGDSYNKQMLEIQREIELAKKRQELQKVQQQTLDAMNPQGQPGAVPAPAPEGPPPDAGVAGAPAEAAPEAMAGQLPMPEEQIPAPAAGAVTAPPGGEGIKMGSFTKQAFDYIRARRPHAGLLIKAAQEAHSLEAIKKEVSKRDYYPWANPYGSLIRTRQKLAKMLDECFSASAKNEEMKKEASAELHKAVSQYMWNGGNLGEVAHLMHEVNGNESEVKLAFASLCGELSKQGMDLIKAEADSIQYGICKTACYRVPNLNHPIAKIYASMCKLAEGDTVFSETNRRIQNQYNLVDKAIKEGLRNAS